ncbi:MAG: GatB/YqeY domain-containing protein [Mangrovibacterium sp.]
MNLQEQINADLKDAMKARDKARTAAIRNVKKVVIEAQTASAGVELEDNDIIKMIQKLAKQGADSANLYKDQGREDLYAEEMEQVAVFESYLPKKMTDAELADAVKAIIDRVGASSMADMGKVMGIASKELAGKADGADVAAKVKALLA